MVSISTSYSGQRQIAFVCWPGNDAFPFDQPHHLCCYSLHPMNFFSIGNRFILGYYCYGHEVVGGMQPRSIPSVYSILLTNNKQEIRYSSWPRSDIYKLDFSLLTDLILQMTKENVGQRKLYYMAWTRLPARSNKKSVARTRRTITHTLLSQPTYLLKSNPIPTT